MLNADANDWLALDFEEVLNVLYKNQSIDVTKLKKLPAMGADEHGFNREAVITAERRVKLLNSIVGQMEKRQSKFRMVPGRYHFEGHLVPQKWTCDHHHPETRFSFSGH